MRTYLGLRVIGIGFVQDRARSGAFAASTLPLSAATASFSNPHQCLTRRRLRRALQNVGKISPQSNWGRPSSYSERRMGAKEEEYRPSSLHILDRISHRLVGPEDIARCHEIEAASYPEDEAASHEKLRYRQQCAREYFWCTTLPQDKEDGDDIIIGFICSTRCDQFTDESMSAHDPNGSILAIHSVVVAEQHRRCGIASAMMKNYLISVAALGFDQIMLLAKSHLLGFYVDNGFSVLRPSPIVHGRETWYELEGRRGRLEMIRKRTSAPIPKRPMRFEASRSTCNPEEGADTNELILQGRVQRRERLHAELIKLGIDPAEMESHPEKFGNAAMRTYNSFLLPKSAGALASAESPSRPGVVANSISFLSREFLADREDWLRNVDRNRAHEDSTKNAGMGREGPERHPITIVLDNVRSAHNVGNILRLAEAAGVESVRLCGMTPRPPHPKVLKTAMGAAEHVSLGDYNDVDGSTNAVTLNTVVDLQSKGYAVYGVETTENANALWDVTIGAPGDDASDDGSNRAPIAFVFGNELIGVDVRVLRQCDSLVRLPMYGFKNSLNVATCVGIVVWETLRRMKKNGAG